MIVFRAYLHQKWIDLRQTKTKIIIGLFYISPDTFHQRNASFCDNVQSVHLTVDLLVRKAKQAYLYDIGKQHVSRIDEVLMYDCACNCKCATV